MICCVRQPAFAIETSALFSADHNLRQKIINKIGDDHGEACHVRWGQGGANRCQSWSWQSRYHQGDHELASESAEAEQK